MNMMVVIIVLVVVVVFYLSNIDSVKLKLLESIKLDAKNLKIKIYEYYDGLLLSEYYTGSPVIYKSNVNKQVRRHNIMIDRYNNGKYFFQPKLNQLEEWK